MSSPAPTTVLRDDAPQYLRQFLGWVLIVCLSFALLEGIAYLRFRETGAGITAVALLVYAVQAALARHRWGAVGKARTVAQLCLGILFTTLIVAYAQPSWAPALVLTPLVAVMLALPYVEVPLIRGLIFSSWLVAVFVVLLAEVRPVAVRLPPWYASAFRVCAVAAAFATVLLLLWQFSSRLTGMLAQTRAAEERYALAAQGAKDGLWDWDLLANHIYYSPRWQTLVGVGDGELAPHPDEWFHRLHPEDADRVRAQIEDHLAGATPHFESEYRLRHQDGDYRWMLSRGLAVRDDSGRAARFAGSQTDITTRKTIEQQLLYAAYHDTLTSLPNRSLFMKRLDHALQRARDDEGCRFGVLFMDLDRFKVLNDSLGHTIGDHLLIEVGARLRGCLRPYDVVARLGGDEFTVLLTEITTLAEVERVADRILETLAAPFHLQGNEIFITCSMGIVLSAAGYQHPEEYLRDADIALYRAKGQGKARYAIFDQAMRQRALELMQMETDLHRAVERDEFSLVYQPIVSLRDGRIAGFEALLRWDHPERGMVRPKRFVPLAEEMGLIVPLSWSVLRQACRQLCHWQETFALPLTINVNWSRRLFDQPDLIDRVVQVIGESHIPPHALRLEITESVIMQENDVLVHQLSQLQALGIQLQIDDFGTGYSSLSTLNTFPIDALKIDRSFIRRLDGNGDNLAIVQAIVTLAHTLGMDVIAEGVETHAQLERLRALGCDYGQGHYFARPLPADQIGPLLAAAQQR